MRRIVFVVILAGCGGGYEKGVSSAQEADADAHAQAQAHAHAHAHAQAQAQAQPQPQSPALISLAPSARSSELLAGFFNPMPGGVLAGYRADTGLDIAGSPRPIFAIASGTLDYSEPGHTLWTGPSDTANCIRFALDHPIAHRGH